MKTNGRIWVMAFSFVLLSGIGTSVAMENDNADLLNVGADPALQSIDVNHVLIKGLWSLTTETRPINIDDLKAELHLDLDHYNDLDKQEKFRWTWEQILTIKESSIKSAPQEELIHTIFLGPLQGSVTTNGRPGLPPSQQIQIRFADGFCVSPSTITDQIGVKGKVGNRTSSHGGYVSKSYYFISNNGTTRSVLEMGTECSSTVTINKYFSKDILNKNCSFNYDRSVIDQL